MQRILVDTNVFIDFFRSNSRKHDWLKEKFLDRAILLSCYVKLELLLGVKKNERARLEEVLSPLSVVASNSSFFELVYSLSPIAKQAGINPGAIDFLIVIQALGAKAVLATRDRSLQKLAQLLDVDLLVPQG